MRRRGKVMRPWRNRRITRHSMAGVLRGNMLGGASGPQAQMLPVENGT